VRTEAAVTYQDAVHCICRWHEAFRDGGLTAGQRIALRVPNSVGFAVLYLAVLTYGATVVPINPAAPDGEVERLMQNVAPNLFLTSAEDAPTVCPAWRVDPNRPDRLPPDRPPAHKSVPRDPDTGSVLLYTSGTTGEPKGVRLDTGRLTVQAKTIAAHHRFGPDDVGYSSLPLFHVNAQVVGLLTAVTAGATLALDDRFHAHDFWDVVNAARPTWINAVPAMLGILANGPGPVGDVTGVRFVRSASAPLPLPVLTRFERRFGLPIVETYGLTEAASQVAANPIPPGIRKPGSVGLPIGVDLEVVDEDGRPLAPYTDGEVRIRGPLVISGYLNQIGPGPFRHGWFYTGDRGHKDEDGYLYLTGRSRELINRGGQKVSPREVEEVLLLHPAVHQVAVIGIPHPVLGEEVAACVVASPGAAPSLVAELNRLSAAHLSPYKRPVRIVLLDHLPVGPTGKIQRLSLKCQILAGAYGGGI
jgi:acyl-CoA synthetase (AMP-forming)/AMP-acid ligase II